MPDDKTDSKSEAKREDDSPLPSDSLANHDTHVQSGADLEAYSQEQQRERVERGEPADNFTGASLADQDAGHVGQVRDEVTGAWKESDSLAAHDTHVQTGADLEAYAQERDRERIARGGKSDNFTGASLADHDTHVQSGADLEAYTQQQRRERVARGEPADNFTGASLADHDTHVQSGASLRAHEVSLADHSTQQVQRDRAAAKRNRNGVIKKGSDGRRNTPAHQNSSTPPLQPSGTPGLRAARRSSFSVAALRHTARNSFAAGLQIASRMNSFQAGRAIARA